jgi:hypothetical protein
MTAQNPQDQNQNQQGRHNEQRGPSTTPGQGGQQNRSENLLPADDAADGRYDVAEEVSLDQQSDAARRVGQPPKGIASDAVADALKPEKLSGDEGLDAQDTQGPDA